MTKVALSLSILAAAVLGACSSYAPSEPKIVAQPLPYYAGYGVVQSVKPAPGPIGAASGASAAPKSPAPAGARNRLTIKMDDGRVQYVDTDSRDFSPGSRIQLTEDRIITKG